MAYWTDTMQFKVSSSDQVNMNKWVGRESPTVEYSTAKESGNDVEFEVLGANMINA